MGQPDFSPVVKRRFSWRTKDAIGIANELGHRKMPPHSGRLVKATRKQPPYARIGGIHIMVQVWEQNAIRLLPNLLRELCVNHTRMIVNLEKVTFAVVVGDKVELHFSDGGSHMRRFASKDQLDEVIA
jgi:hypothetical protein